jgi:succinate dehydrogenase membrane anchor subunit
MRTALKNISGLGAAGKGVHHYLKQRMTAAALLVLIPLFLYQFLASFTSGYAGVVAWLGSPLGAGVTFLCVSALVVHMRLGVQTVIEDYFGGGIRNIGLILNNLFALLLWLSAIYALIKISFGS